MGSEQESLKTGLVRKISFPVLGGLISLGALASMFDPGGGDHSTWTTLPSVASGVVLAALGFRRWTALWYLFFSFFSLIPLDAGRHAAYTGLYPPGFIMAIALALLLLLAMVFVPLAAPPGGSSVFRKELASILILALLFPGTAYCLGFVNGKAVQYAGKVEHINFILPERFSSMEECKDRHVMEESGYCYGYFASQKEDMSLCKEYIDANVDPLLNRHYIEMSCSIGYSIYQDDPSICRELTEERFQAKCLFHFFISKKEFEKCSTLTYRPFDHFSFSSEKCLEYDPPWHVRKFAEVAYYEKFK